MLFYSFRGGRIWIPSRAGGRYAGNNKHNLPPRLCLYHALSETLCRSLFQQFWSNSMWSSCARFCKRSSGPAVSLITAYDPQKRVYLSKHMKDNFLPQIYIRSPRIKQERAQQWNTKTVCWCRVVWKMTGTISSLSLCRLKDLFLRTWNIPLTWNTSFECKLKPPRPKRPVPFSPLNILRLKHLVQAVNFLGGVILTDISC